MPKTKLCPDCEKEYQDPEDKDNPVDDCPNCGFPITGFALRERMNGVSKKLAERKAEEEKSKSPKKKGGVLRHLGGL